MKLRTAFIGTIIALLSITACNKVSVENIPFILELIDDSGEVNFGESIELDILANDVIDGDEIIVSVIVDPQYGEVTFVSGQENMMYEYKHAGEYLDNEDNTTPDQFTYQVCIDGNCETADVVITVNEIDVPDECKAYARNNSYSTKTDYVEMEISEILENDETPCSNWDIESLQIVSDPSSGTTEIEGDKIIYRAYNVYWERDEFMYLICDGYNQCKTATIKITNGNINVPTQL